jgi:hypothetical protein
MPIDDYNVLAPNYLGATMANGGLEGLVANYGYGVAETLKTNQKAELDQKKSANPVLDPIRTAKARQFGRTKETVGF